MQNQKRENLLNLALSATDEERERSENLDVGYDPEERTWELIVRHSGSLAGLAGAGIQVDELLVNCRRSNTSKNQRGCSLPATWQGRPPVFPWSNPPQEQAM